MSKDVSLVGKTIHNYEIKEEIGRGGMATVYKGYQQSLDRHVAVKVFSSETPSGAVAKERFNRELRASASLEHPHIVPVFDYGISDGLPFIVMRYLPGETLYTRVGRGSFYTMPELARPAEQIASALDYMHTKGVLHHDVKPQNVLLDTRGDAYLTEPALILNDGGLTATGTPAYMSPEASLGTGLVAASDLYGFGISLYQLLSGKLPFDGDTPMAMLLKHISDPVPSLADVDPKLAPADPIFARILAKDPEDRYASATAFVNELSAALKGDNRRPVAVKPAPAPAPDYDEDTNPGIAMPAQPPATKKTTSRPTTSKRTPQPTVDPVTQVRPTRIFVSYAVLDSALVLRLIASLRGQQHSVWFDGELEGRGGQKWWDLICEQIRENELFVFALSENSLKSVACQREYEYAHALHKHILPVSIGDFNYKIDLPQQLAEIQIVDFRNEDNGSLARSISQLPSTRDMPNPLPENPPVPVLPVQEFADELRTTHKGKLTYDRQGEILNSLELLLLAGESVPDVVDLLERYRDRGDWADLRKKKLDQMLKEYGSRRGFFGFRRGKRN